MKENRERYKQALEFRKKNKPFLFKPSYNSIIPLKIFTCWHTKNLPPFMRANVRYLQKSNPEFRVFLYDEDACRQFIKKHFDDDVLHAYNALKPCSYKSDLWRYCVLYLHGGIYVDIKYRCINKFRFIALTEKEHFVKDLDGSGGGTYTALICTLPKNEIMMKCIREIVNNVANKYYGANSLDPTGPCLLGRFSSREEKLAMELHFESTHIEGYYNNIFYIMYNDYIIMTYYKEYRDEQSKYQKFERYGDLWDKKDIYY